MVSTRVRIGEYEAWVVVEDQEIEHYGIEVNEETKVATCWIASTAGQRFGIWVAKRHDNFDCATDMNLDGSSISGFILRKSDTTPRLRGYALSGDKSAQPLLFGVLGVTDDESVLNSQQRYEELGNIEVIFHHAVNCWKPGTSWPSPPQVSENDRIHERAKKAVTHRVLFGQMKTTEKSHDWVTCMRQEKVATFIFRYRSIDLLRAKGIIPNNGPAPGESVTTEAANNNSVSRKRKAVAKEEEFTDVEIDSEDEDKRKEAELEAELEKIRKARLNRKHTHKKVKRESRPVFLPGEVIDLTI